ncbi:Glycosyl transferase [Desulfovibrionales bacterium]
MHHFCTYFDHRYLGKGLALLTSLRRHCPEAILWVLALTETCRTLISQGHQGIEVIDLDEVEDEILRTARRNRSLIEYYFTLTPVLPLYLLTHRPEIDRITYVDCDTWFFTSPVPVLNELGNASIGITPHRFTAPYHHLEIYGRYNVGWMTFRHDKNALACLHWYRDRCIEWCYDRVEKERFADQKYLDYIFQHIAGVRSIDHPGVNLAPWNVMGHWIVNNNGKITVDGQPLVHFHFHGLQRLAWHFYDTGLAAYGGQLTPTLREYIYRPYLREVCHVESKFATQIVPNTKKKEMDSLRPNGTNFTYLQITFPHLFEQLRMTKRLLRVLTARTMIACRNS